MILIDYTGDAHHRNTSLGGWAEHEPISITRTDHVGEADFHELEGHAYAHTHYSRCLARNLYTLPKVTQRS